ncbi:MAG TPA: hypothetical protein PKD52_12065 [Clostridiales bacterium]|nr:hypothetical protein [Clostridiales bacterium]
MFYAPSFQAISVTVTIAQSFDAKEALRVATEKVIKAGYEPAFPCYIFYLLSSGDFDHAVRYYEVLFPMGKKA